MRQVDRAYNFLRLGIEQGEFPPGRALPTQPALARSIGVSTVTLRQALERLAREGFVEAQQGRGTFVRSQRALAGPVLVADDDPSMRSLLADSLEALGFQAEVVGSGEAAVERVRQRRFSHVLLDLRMGQLDGAAAGAQITRLDPQTVIVFITAYPVDLFEAASRRLGPALVLRKPFSLDELEQVLRLRQRAN